MIYYSSYYVDGCEDKKISHLFLRAILANSDAFSLVYFKYRENEKFSKGVSGMKKRLAPYKIDSRNVTEWPGTKILSNERNHFYRMETYRVDMDVLPALEEVDTIWDWDYPDYPMDPCFYKNGFVWFTVTAHEHLNTLYLKDSENFPLATDLESIGVSLIPRRKVGQAELFYNKYLKEI